MFLVMEGLVIITMHIAGIVEVDWLKAIIKNLNNFLLKKACKMKDKALDFLGNLIYNIVIFFS